MYCTRLYVIPQWKPYMPYIVGVSIPILIRKPYVPYIVGVSISILFREETLHII